MARVILWAAGGGSSGFGGGGGGGGGFSGGGGSGSGGGSLPLWAWLLIIAFFAGSFVWASLVAWRLQRRRKARAARVALASVEAATDDPQFAAEFVVGLVGERFAEIQKRWSENDVDGLARLVGEDLMVEWRRRLEDFAAKGWRNICTPLGAPSVSLMGLVNRVGEAEDRVTVLVEGQFEDYVLDRDGNVVTRNETSSKTVSLAEYWTFAQRADDWILVAIEQAAEGDAHHLGSEVVAVPEADARIADEALVEIASAEGEPAFATAEIADVDLLDDARAAALDLSLADPRFGPDVLEASARRAVSAWAEAVDGADDPLLAVASREAADALLYAGDATQRTRVVLRGGRVSRLAITGIAASPEPARMEAEVSVSGVRYLEDRDTAAVLSGSKTSATDSTLRFTFALDGADATPWRLVAVR